MSSCLLQKDDSFFYNPLPSYPLMTAIGLNLMAFLEMPAAWHVSTTEKSKPHRRRISGK